MLADMLALYVGGQNESAFPPGQFQGDIRGFDKGHLKSGKLNVISDTSKRWPKGVIPYTLGPSCSNGDRPREKILIKQAMAQMSSSARNCIRFMRWTNESDFVSILRRNWCSSSVGRQTGSRTVDHPHN